MLFDDTMLIVMSSLILTVILLVYLYFKNIEKHTEGFMIEEYTDKDQAVDVDPNPIL